MRIRPLRVLRPIAGNQSPMALIRRKIATTASSCGNICTTTIVMSPTRRPAKRMRENAYAASAPMNTMTKPVTVADDERVEEPHRVRDLRIGQDAHVAVDADRREQLVRARQGALRVQRRRQHVQQREDGEDRDDDRDDMTPPGIGEPSAERPAAPRRLAVTPSAAAWRAPWADGARLSLVTVGPSVMSVQLLEGLGLCGS